MRQFNFWKLFVPLTLHAVPDGDPSQDVDEEVQDEDQTTEDLVREELGLEDESVETPDVEDEDGDPTDEPDEEEAKDTEAADKIEDQEEYPDKITDKDDSYTEPEGLSEKASDRFKSLVTSNKEKDAQMEELQTRVDSFSEIVQSSGASSEEFSQLINYSSLAVSGDPTKMQEALNILNIQRDNLCRALGVEAGGYDPISEHSDLAEKVEFSEMDKETALELVRGRNQQKQQQEYAVRSQQEASQQAAQIQTRNDAVGEISRLQQQWESSDIDFKVKLPLLEKQAKVITEKYPAHLWASALADQYSLISSAMIDQASRAKVPAPNPARSNTVTAGVKEAKTTMDLAKQILNIEG